MTIQKTPTIHKAPFIYKQGSEGSKPVPYDANFSILIDQKIDPILSVNDELFKGIFKPRNNSVTMGVLFTDDIDVSSYDEFIFSFKCKYTSKLSTGYNQKYLLNRYPTSGRLFAFVWNSSLSRFQVAYLGPTQNDFLDFQTLPASFNLNTPKELKFYYKKSTGEFKFTCDDIDMVSINIGNRQVTTWRIDFGTETLSYYAYFGVGDEVYLNTVSFICDGNKII